MKPEHPSDPRLSIVHLDRGPVAYTDEGQGPTILALHGLPGSVRDYRWLAPCLTGAARLVRLDLPGSGGTPLAEPGEWSPAGRAAVVAGVIEALGLAPVVALGHSAGGPVIAELARSRPELVAAVVFLACPGPEPHRGIRGMPVRAISRALSTRPGRALLRWPLSRGYAAQGFPSSLSDDDRFGAIHGISRLSFPRHSENLAGLTQPTAVFSADDDPLIEAPIIRQLAAACPEGPRRHYETGGHNIQKTRAVEIAQALLAWLPTVIPPAT